MLYADVRFNFPGSEGFVYEIEAVEACLAAGALECEDFTLDESLYVARLVDATVRQLGATVL
jgi:hypothetical protein